MPFAILPDGKKMEFQPGDPAIAVVKAISNSLAKKTLAVRIDDTVTGTATAMPEKDVNFAALTFEDKEGRDTMRHTASHILAQAVKRLFPEAKLAIGPAIENGFYYDFDIETAFTNDDLPKIEAEMAKIIKEGYKVERFELPRAEALKLMEERAEPYKVELINDLPEDAVISFYRQGEFTDLCAGPHLSSVSGVKAFKLTSATGAYWRGDSDRKMLKRIYGTAFPDAESLNKYLADVEEAKKRDHNLLGRQLGYFTTSEMIGQGLPIILPKGTIVMRTLQRFVEDEEERRGYLQTKTPFMAKRELYKISGHWDHYRDGMFVFGSEEDQDNPEKEILALRPMTCPFQFQAYLTELRSYRDLPLRYNETSTLFRNEASGEMHGLIRVRQFTISEGHLACTPEQLETEFAGCLELAVFMLKTLGLDDDVSYRFSKWDENDRDKYIGDASEWEAVQNTMRKILDDLKIDYFEADGEAAFYGPKLDIQIKNVHGKEDTLITIQIDFQLAKRFGMEYIDRDGEKKNPYVIHRTSIGCYERTLALLIEKYAGAMPLWLAPVQAELIPISENHIEYAEKVKGELMKAGIRAHVDSRSEKMGYKIRQAQLEKTPYMLIMGDKEAADGTVSVRSRKKGDMGAMTVEEIVSALRREIDSKEK